MSKFEYKQAHKLIEQAKHILLLTDERIDGDTIGSTLGMYHVLIGMGKHVEVFSPKPLPQILRFIPGTQMIQGDPVVFKQSSIDLIIVFDCSDGEYFKPFVKTMNTKVPMIVFDHHVTNPRYGTINIIEPEAAAAAYVVWDFIKIIE